MRYFLSTNKGAEVSTMKKDDLHHVYKISIVVGSETFLNLEQLYYITNNNNNKSVRMKKAANMIVNIMPCSQRAKEHSTLYYRFECPDRIDIENTQFFSQGLYRPHGRHCQKKGELEMDENVP